MLTCQFDRIDVASEDECRHRGCTLTRMSVWKRPGGCILRQRYDARAKEARAEERRRRRSKAPAAAQRPVAVSPQQQEFRCPDCKQVYDLSILGTARRLQCCGCGGWVTLELTIAEPATTAST